VPTTKQNIKYAREKVIEYERDVQYSPYQQIREESARVLGFYKDMLSILTEMDRKVNQNEPTNLQAD
jgi:hypothetical protein